MSADASHLLGAVFLLALSGLFSGSETALFSLPRHALGKARRSRSFNSQAIVNLVERPRRLLVTVLLGNTIVNILYFATAYSATVELSSHNAELAVALGAGTFLTLLAFGEILPKAIAIRHPAGVARFAALPLSAFTWLLTPPRVLLGYIVDLASAIFGMGAATGRTTAQELQALVELSENRGYLDIGEGKMIAAAMRLREIKVSEVMVPRVDMVVCSVSASVQDFLMLARRTGMTKMPIYERSRDNILGAVYVKDAIFSSKSSLKDLARPVYYVPELANLESLLEQFRQRHVQFAVAVDEFGGTAGIVSLEDVLEVIVGEIRDEFDQEAEALRPVAPGKYLASGGLALRELGQSLGLDLESESADTLAGLIAERLGKIPSVGDVVELPGLRLSVTKVAGRRVVEVEVLRKEPPK